MIGRIVRTGLVSILAMAALLALIACASTQEAIIGTWKLNHQEETMEFQEDGTIINTRDSDVIFKGTYEFIDDTHIQVTPNEESAMEQTVFEVDIRGAQMSLTEQGEGGGRVGIFTRVH
jgi:hypothetical protein